MGKETRHEAYALVSLTERPTITIVCGNPACGARLEALSIDRFRAAVWPLEGQERTCHACKERNIIGTPQRQARLEFAIPE